MPRWSSSARLQGAAPSLVLATLLTLALAACADSPYRTSNRQEVKGDGMSVMITHARNEAEGRPLADDYCHAQGGAAHFKGIVQYHTRRETSKAASFECQA
jgi:hypothetical protein